MILCKTVGEIKKKIATARAAGETIGLVPTMGALHEGHATLIDAANKENDVVVVSVFVNPTQFGPNEDLGSYPRTLDADIKLAENMGADIVFAPTPKEMYPSEDMTWVEVTGNITKVLCGATRPIHFRGVTTVVAKLFNLVQPTRAYFGQKDAQQVQVLTRMVKDMFFPVELRIMPIVRELDGLAKSSRNIYLSVQERQAGLIISQSLKGARESFSKGERNAEKIVKMAKDMLEKESLATIDYVEMYALPDLTTIVGPMLGRNLLAIAIKLGDTRLIDNIILEVE